MSDAPENIVDRLKRLNGMAPAQRTRFMSAITSVSEHMQPGRLAQKAGNRLLDWGLDSAEKAKDAARANPLKILGLAAVFGAILARRPLAKLIASGLAAGLSHFKSENGNAPEAMEKSEE